MKYGVDGGVTIVSLTPEEHVTAAVTLDVPAAELVDISFDNRRNRLWLLSQDGADLVQIAVDTDGAPNPATMSKHDLSGLGLQKVVGMAIDTEDEAFFFLDALARSVIRVQMDELGIGQS